MRKYKDVYLDYAATTPIYPEVLDAMLPYLKDKFGNPSSIHKFGQETRTAIEICRSDLAKLINAKQSEIYFTSGGTESINQSLIGAARVLRDEYGKTGIITTKAEHNATIEVCKFLETQGFSVNYLKPDKDGKISTEQLKYLINEKTGLISVIHINNETGTINEIKEIAQLAKEFHVFIHIDAVQSFGKTKIDVEDLKIDFLSASAHKINGPKGAGFLYVRTGTPISNMIYGGSQERNRRGGTENVAGIIGLAEAAKINFNNIDTNLQKVTELKSYFLEQLKACEDLILINSPSEGCSPYILNISLNPEYFDVDQNTLIMNFAIRGVAISSGSACTSGVLEPSHVLMAMGYDEKRSSMAMRFSFSPFTTFSEIDYAIEVMKEIIQLLKRKTVFNV